MYQVISLSSGRPRVVLQTKLGAHHADGTVHR
jgi:hypothetical protein